VRSVISYHVRPYLINVRRPGKIHHIRSETAAGTHIHLQADKVSLSSQSLLIFQKSEKLKVNEPASDPETFHRRPSRLTGIAGKVLQDIKYGIIFIVHDIHDRNRSHVAGFKQRLPAGID